MTQPQRHRTARAGVAAATMAWRAGRLPITGQIVLAVMSGAAPVAAAWLLRTVIDGLVDGGGRAILVPLAVLLATMGGITNVLPSMAQYLAAQLNRAAGLTATTELFGYVTRLRGLRRLEDPEFQDRLSIAQHVAVSSPGQVVSSLVAIGQSSLTLAGFLVTVAVLSPILAGVLVVAAVPALYLQRDVARRQAALLNEVTHGQRRQSFYAGLLLSVPAAKEIRLFGLGGFLRARMLDELLDVQLASRRMDRRVLGSSTALAGIGTLVGASGVVWAVAQATAGRLTTGDVTVFVTALVMVSSSIEMVTSYASSTYQAALMFASYLDVVGQAPDLPVPVGAAPPDPLRRGIELEDVWFRCEPDGPWILRGVSCFIPRGHAVALVGYNGAGKTTLVKLLCRFYDPDRGRILWDGVDLRDLDLNGLRDRISVVFQDYMNYELSAADNIAVGDLSQRCHADAIKAAARGAGIHDVIAALPHGYDTQLTRAYFDLADKDDPQTGVLLSGGQWQRLAIARAQLRGARDLVVLDEPSSGLDAEAEHDIQVRLAGDRASSATVLISHRLNTVRDADHIVVLSDGAVAEQGTHATLMAEAGIYARLFSLQAEGYADATGGPSD
jgi:ATP-binding cassette, subfamily B, bacterial